MTDVAHPSANTLNSVRHSLPMLAEAATALDAAGYTVFSTLRQKPYVVRPFSIASAAYWAFDHDFTAQDKIGGPAMEVSWPTQLSPADGFYSITFMTGPDGRLSEDTTRHFRTQGAVVEAADVFFKGDTPSNCPDLLNNSRPGTPRWLEGQRDIFMAAARR